MVPRMSAIGVRGSCRSVEVVEVGEEDDAFLFVGVGAGDDGDDGVGEAGVVGQVGHVGGDVEEVALLDDGVVFEMMAVPYTGGAGEGIDGGLVGGVFVGAGAASGGDGDELHVDARGADGFGGDGDVVLEALLADEGLVGLDEAAGGWQSDGRGEEVVGGHGGLLRCAGRRIAQL